MADAGGTGGRDVEVDGHRIRLTNLDKVMYPATGTTKAEVIAYYTTVSQALIAVARDRPVTRKRWPHGVERNVVLREEPAGGDAGMGPARDHPPLGRAVRPRSPGPRLPARPTTTATLVWLAQVGALELHAPQWRIDPASGDPLEPDRLVIDLDPGPPAGLDECAEVALVARQMLEAHGLELLPVTSGSKGMQLYARLPPTHRARRRACSRGPGASPEYAHALAQALERALPDLVVSQMSRALRPGRVFIDWSQNNPAKTTIVPWSLRGRATPTAAVPVRWADVERGGLRQLTMAEAAERVASDAGLLAALGDTAP